MAPFFKKLRGRSFKELIFLDHSKQFVLFLFSISVIFVLLNYSATVAATYFLEANL